jgi:SAM-dependent methyltransferase
MLAVAQQAASIEGLTIDFQLASIDHGLPFESGAFDFLICALMLCHVPNLAQAIQEFSRVLQHDGYLLITAFHPEAIARGWRTDFRRGDRRYLLPNMPHTRADYLEALATAGFKVLHIIDVPLSAVPDGYLPEALLGEAGEKLLCLIVLAQKQSPGNQSS